jgi:hypothetical protein
VLLRLNKLTIASWGYAIAFGTSLLEMKVFSSIVNRVVKLLSCSSPLKVGWALGNETQPWERICWVSLRLTQATILLNRAVLELMGFQSCPDKRFFEWLNPH